MVKHTNQKTYGGWGILKQDPYLCCVPETNFRSKDTHSLKVKGWKRYFWKWKQTNKAGIAIVVPEKIYFKTKAVTRDKEGSSSCTSWCSSTETQKTVKQKDMQHMFNAALFTIAKIWAQPRCSSVDEWIKRSCINMQWNVTQPQRRMKSCHL